MKYYLIAGEASGDLHASRLMSALRRADPEAEFRFIGGDLMTAVGGQRVVHYRDLAYMGFIPVLLHLNTIFRHMRLCKQDIKSYSPDALILIDYPGFNLSIAKYVHAHTRTPVFYYISPKIWAWKEYRIRRIKRDVDRLFSILPFEVDFYEGKHQYPICYVGNPTVDEVHDFRTTYHESFDDFTRRNKLTDSPIVALLAGSRKQEIKDNLPPMLKIVSRQSGCQAVIAGAPGIDPAYYERFLQGGGARVVYNQTYALLSHATAAMVTSGTATLETAMFGVPQVVVYRTPIGPVISWLRGIVLKVKYISLVNLIAGREVVRELVAADMTDENMNRELERLLDDGEYRQQQLAGYEEVSRRLGQYGASARAAHAMVEWLENRQG